MITSHNKYDAIENLIYNEGLKIQSLEFSPTYRKMFIHLTNDTTFVVRTHQYPNLKKASVQQLKNFSLIGNGAGIHWPEVDEDLSLKGFLKELNISWLHKRKN
ncbi:MULTISPECIES: DUF2442 domain-containing protein [unclassified Asinibacterium]|jgi:hypothetical protein|uniref:DUF2442 domain-containing protein n=1 Tax=Asinibacterium sp. OR53 TaxID=925409 RepID=UPI0006885047